jgi:hypothetical protein
MMKRNISSSIFYTVALAFALLLGAPASHAFVTVGVSITVPPPELPVYEQPPVPGPGYLWTPGYWAWADDGYYWVPGTWVEPPQEGYLWTPGYWGWNNGVYLWNGGYWGTHIGFYGGVNYGFGYVGHGYEGGYWDHGAFRYNSAYNNLHGNTRITNVYNKTVIINNNNRASFNGGNGGIQARPGAQELAAEHEHHLTPVSMQLQHEEGARGNPALRASSNHGVPPIGATAHPGVFAGQGVVATHPVMIAQPGVMAQPGVTPHPSGFNAGAGGAPAHVTPAAPPHVTGGAPAVVPGAGTGGPPHGTVPPARIQHTVPPPGGAGPPKAAAPKAPMREPREEHGSEQR